MKPIFTDAQVTEALTGYSPWGTTNLTFSFREASFARTFSEQQKQAERIMGVRSKLI